ncbi:MAG: hypothetical protein JPMHGGIA_02361 [Saprospiraceae bacterium]|nr:hypothetical protein [Saprospiraceae bacterium]
MTIQSSFRNKVASLQCLAAVVLLFGMTGCIPSLNPLYTEKDLVFLPELLGTWTDPKSNEIWTFDKKSKTEYVLTHADSNYRANFRAHLVKIGETIFLDLFPVKQDAGDYLYQMHVFPVHTFSKLTTSKDQVTIAMLDLAWLEEGLDSNELAIEHAKANGTTLLTASTEELQAFMLKYANDAAAFSDPLVLQKSQ